MKNITINLNVAEALSVIANIQLATRHPQNNGPSSQIGKAVAREIQGIVSLLYPEMATIMEMGWNPETDIHAN